MMLENQLNLPLETPTNKIHKLVTPTTECFKFVTSYGAEIRMYQPSSDEPWTYANIVWLLEQAKHELLKE